MIRGENSSASRSLQQKIFGISDNNLPNQRNGQEEEPRRPQDQPGDDVDGEPGAVERPVRGLSRRGLRRQTLLHVPHAEAALGRQRVRGGSSRSRSRRRRRLGGGRRDLRAKVGIRELRGPRVALLLGLLHMGEGQSSRGGDGLKVPGEGSVFGISGEGLKDPSRVASGGVRGGKTLFSVKNFATFSFSGPFFQVFR